MTTTPDYSEAFDAVARALDAFSVSASEAIDAFFKIDPDTVAALGAALDIMLGHSLEDDMIARNHAHIVARLTAPAMPPPRQWQQGFLLARLTEEDWML